MARRVVDVVEVLHLLTHLLNEDFHVDRDFGELKGGRLGAQGVGFAVQLLDEEVEALANVAAFFDQAADFVQM